MKKKSTSGDDGKEPPQMGEGRLMKRKRRVSIVKRLLTFLFSVFFVSFDCSPKVFAATKLVLGAAVGGMIGTGLYYSLAHPMPLTEEQKETLFYGTSASFAIGWATSSKFRSTVWIISPNILGKEGQTYMFLYVLGSAYNMIDIKSLWNDVRQTLWYKEEQHNTKGTTPQDVAIKSSGIKHEDYVAEAERSKNETGKGRDSNWPLSAQEKFDLKTMPHCDFVIKRSVYACHKWFDKKHEECMNFIYMPGLKSLLCLPFKFKFLCSIYYVWTPRCVNMTVEEANLSQFNVSTKGFTSTQPMRKVEKDTAAERSSSQRLTTGDKLSKIFAKINETVYSTVKGFTTSIVEQSMFIVINVTQLLFEDPTAENNQQDKAAEMNVSRMILSCTVIYVFMCAYGYCHRYNSKQRFHNVYLTAYFQQTLRKKQMFKRMLRRPEWKSTLMEFLHCIPILLFLIFSLIIDRILEELYYSMAELFYKSVAFSGLCRLQVVFGEDHFVSTVVQTTMWAVNAAFGPNNTGTSRDLSNATDYIRAFLGTVGFLFLCILYHNVSRFRLVVASFLFPKREKQYIQLCYNELLRKRAGIKRECLIVTSRLLHQSFINSLCSHLRWIRWFYRRRCILCSARNSKTLHICNKLDCGTAYCRRCWEDMQQLCIACVPYEQGISITGEGRAGMDQRYYPAS